MQAPVSNTFLILVGVIAVVGMISGTVLATTGYSSAGAFSVASACVGVLGGIAIGRNGEKQLPPDETE